MLETGILVFLGLLGLAIKLPRRIVFRALGYPVALDLSVTALVYVLHLGTFSGLMTAAVAGLFCSATISGMRWAFGYVKADRYYPGVFHINPRSLV